MSVKFKFEFYFYSIVAKLFNFLGDKSIRASSNFIAFLFFYIIRIRRNVVLKNLTIAFPNLSQPEIKKLAFKNYQSISITFLEIFNFPKKDRSYIKTHLIDKGFDVIREKYKEDKGLILLTAHFGNWELGALAVGIHLNESINVLVKKQKNPYIARWLNGVREMFGNVQIPLGVSVRELYKTIKNKKIVGIVGDQRGSRDGVKVNFFGSDTFTFQGTAAIALKTECPVIVLFCARQDNGTYEGVIEEIVTNDIFGTKDEQIQKFNQRFMSILEKTIKKYPEQWFWMHNIWKY